MTVRFSGGRLLALAALFSTVAALVASPGRADSPPIPNALTCDDYHYAPAGQYLNLAGLNQLAGLRAAGIEIRFDADGVPLVQVGDSFYYNPVVIAQVGLEAISRYSINPTPGDLATAWRMANWFVHTQTRKGTWLYRFPITLGHNNAPVPVPWPSAMAQGQAISLLTRVYRIQHAQKFLRASKRALRSLLVPVAKGGLLADLFGHPFYEEGPTRPPSFILNGFMFTLFGLYDLQTLAPRSAATKLFRDGIATLKFALPLYDVGGGWSLYELIHLTDAPQAPIRATIGYQRVHVLELCGLDSIQPNPVFEFYRDSWRTIIPRL